MTSTASSDSAASAAPAAVRRPRTVSTLMRLHPFVRGSYTRLTLGIGTAIVGAIVALAIPVVLSWIVDGPLTTLDTAQIFPAVGLIAALGVLEAVLIALRRWLVLKPGTHVGRTFARKVDRVRYVAREGCQWQRGCVARLRLRLRVGKLKTNHKSFF